jgi:2-methylcitrate dehydratase PrpD
VTTADAAGVLAEHAARTTYADLTAPLVAHVKLCILDTLACAMAGSSTKEAQAVHGLVARWGGAPESTVVSFGDRVPAIAAALANAAMVHQHDFDDTHDTAVCHPTSATMTAAMAAGEARGGLSGEELIRAVALGNDLCARLGLALNGTLWDYPWVRAPVVGIFGAALSAGLVLGLEGDGLEEALGLALPQASGTLQCLRSDTSSVRAIRDGFAVKDGVLAAYMAAEGLRGDSGTFDGEYGLYNAFFRGDYDRGRLLAELGERNEAMNVSLKPWPSCRHTHATLTALHDLLDDPGFDRSSIVEIVLHVGDGNAKICRPVGDRFEGRMALLCNLPWVSAAAAAHGDVPLWSFEERGFHDPAIRGMLARIRTVHDPAQNRHGTIEPGHVEVRLAGGDRLEALADRALGHAERPMTAAHVATKVRSCAASSARPPSVAGVDRLIEAALSLEHSADAGELVRLTVGEA